MLVARALCTFVIALLATLIKADLSKPNALPPMQQQPPPLMQAPLMQQPFNPMQPFFPQMMAPGFQQPMPSHLNSGMPQQQQQQFAPNAPHNQMPHPMNNNNNNNGNAPHMPNFNMGHYAPGHELHSNQPHFNGSNNINAPNAPHNNIMPRQDAMYYVPYVPGMAMDGAVEPVRVNKLSKRREEALDRADSESDDADDRASMRASRAHKYEDNPLLGARDCETCTKNPQWAWCNGPEKRCFPCKMRAGMCVGSLLPSVSCDINHIFWKTCPSTMSKVYTIVIYVGAALLLSISVGLIVYCVMLRKRNVLKYEQFDLENDEPDVARRERSQVRRRSRADKAADIRNKYGIASPHGEYEDEQA